MNFEKFQKIVCSPWVRVVFYAVILAALFLTWGYEPPKFIYREF